jgi:hypothetical protein
MLARFIDGLPEKVAFFVRAPTSISALKNRSVHQIMLRLDPLDADGKRQVSFRHSHANHAVRRMT